MALRPPSLNARCISKMVSLFSALRAASGDPPGFPENLKPKSPPTGGPIIEVRRQDKMRLASRLVPPPHAAHPPRRLHPALRSQCAPCSRSSSLYDCAKKTYNLVT